MPRDNAVQELTSLVELQKLEPEKHTIAQLIPEETIHKYTPLDVLTAAFESSCIIPWCCNDHNQYKSNGVWIEPPKELADKLRNYHNLSTTYCPECAEQVRAEIAQVHLLMRERVEVAASY